MENDASRVIDALAALVWSARPDGRIDFVNRRWREYTGLAAEATEAAGHGWQAAVHPDDLPAVRARWQAMLAGGEPGEMEARLRRRDGAYRWFQFRIGPLADARGQVDGWCGMLVDIDDRRRAGQALRASEQRLRLIIDALPTLITLRDAAGDLEFANRHYRDYFGATCEELKTWGHTFHPDDRERAVASWWRSVQAGEPWRIRARRRRADGAYRRFDSCGFPLRDEDGRIALWYLLHTDIEDRSQAEALLSGEKRLLEMVAGGEPMPAILDTLCRLVEGTADGAYCSIVLIAPDGVHLEHGAAPSLPPAFVAAIDGRAVGTESGPCAAAAYLNRPVIAADIASETRWAQSAWCPMALAHGLRSCWSMPIASAGGTVLGVFAIYYDQPRMPTPHHRALTDQFTHIASIVIERAQSDAALKRSEARKAAILNSAIDCIVSIDHAGRIVEFNPSAEQTFGHARDDVVGAPLADIIIPPAQRQRHLRGLARYLATGDARAIGKRMEVMALRADGSEFPVELTMTRIPLDGPPSFTGFLRDITERRRAEETLRRNAAYLAEAQKLSLTGSFGWVVATDEHFWSAETFRIFGYDAATRVTLGLILARVHPQDLPVVQGAVALAAAGADLDYECRLCMPDGAVKHVHVVAHGSAGEAGRLEYIGAVQDVSERRLAEETLGRVRSELAHVARVTTLGALTASIAHEVNQPLAGIITNASTCLRMLAADPPNVDGARETARRTIRDGNRASDVITRLRALFGKKEATAEMVDLNEAAHEVAALSRADLQRNKVILQLELAGDLPPVAGDRVQLQQVILNLLLNASDAMSGIEDRPRRLVIRTGPDESGRVRLAVRDAGTGIGPEGAERLFEAFYTTKRDGMGIGLSVSRSIIDSHQGCLWAEPNGDGPGATFSFSIPCASGSAGRAPDVADTVRAMREA